MAVLTDANRAALWAELMSDASTTRTPLGLSKAQVRAAVDSADSWADGNAASFNTALPVAARNALTAKQKARLLLFVVARRHDVTV